MYEREREVEIVLKDIASKNKTELDSAKIVPLSDDWKFSTNGMYLLCAPPGCGKTRFIIKHILMCDKIARGQSYYSLICYSSTSQGFDRTLQTALDAKVIKCPLVQVKEQDLMQFLERHLKRKLKYYAMIDFLKKKKINETLQHSIDKHNMKYLAYDPKIKRSPLFSDIEHTGMPYDVDVRKSMLVEKTDKNKLRAYVLKKIEDYGVSRTICPLLVIMDDYAGSKLLEHKNTPLVKMFNKCRHYNVTGFISIQSIKWVARVLRRTISDAVLWQGIGREAFYDFFTEIQYAYDYRELFEEYRRLPNQNSYLILNIKAQSYTFVPVETT
jgi:hypothetical protein